MRRFNRALLKKNVKRIVAACTEPEDEEIEILTMSSVLVDPDSLAMIIVLPCIEGESVSRGEVKRLFWKVAVERDWAEERDGQRMVVSALSLDLEDGMGPSMAFYGEILRPDTDYGAVSG